VNIALGDVDCLVTKQPRSGYRIEVRRIRPKGDPISFAVVAVDRRAIAGKRRNLQMSPLLETPEEAWSVFAHGFPVSDYGSSPDLRKLVDHLLESGEAVQLD